MSLPEVLLWRQIRLRPEGLKFRRQHPAGPYVLDFYCDAARFALEIDGGGHDNEAASARDRHRDSWLAEAGICTRRFTANEVLQNLEGVLFAIIEEVRARPLHHPPSAGGPPPLQGGSS
jgi:very-short-patch-repair endonuclease